MKEEIYHITQKSESKRLIRFSLAGTTFPDKSYVIRRSHSYTACIEYVEEGEGTVELDGEIFHPKAGDSYFLAEGCDQHYYCDKENPWKKHFINVSGNLLAALAEGYGVSHTAYFAGLDLKDELFRMIALAKSEGDRTQEMIAVLNEIFMKMHHHTRNRNEKRDLAEEMKDFLNTQVTERFRIDLLCERIGRSESQTIRIFKAAYGITPYGYVLEKKIGLAKTLLSDTTLTVAQIAEKLCFADEYYFSGFFKQKTGISPSAYRRKGE